MASHQGKEMSVKEVLAQFRKNEILTAASELFKAEGYPALTMDRVAEQAGVSKGTLYIYFKDKDELVQSLMDHMSEGFVTGINNTFAEKISARQRFVNIMLLMDDFASKNKHLLTFIHSTEGEEFHKNYDRVAEMMVGQLSKMFEEGMAKGEFRNFENPELVGIFFMGIMNSLLMIRIRQTMDCGKGDIHDLIDLFCHGVCKPE